MKKIIYSIFGLGLCLSVTACSDFLDARNLGGGDLDANTYFSENPDEIRPVAYDAVRYIANHIDLHDQAGDLYINPRSSDDGTFSMFTLNSEDKTVKDYYSKVMGAINKANCLIYYAGENKPKLVAEGKFLRALGYYYMTQQFGAVPYSDNYINTPETSFPRTPLNEIYANILADLEEIYYGNDLPDQDHTGAASKQAAAALAAKVALAAGWDLDTELTDAVKGTYQVKNKEYFNQAASWAEKAIMGIQLTMSFEDKWSYKNEGNAEEIFSAQYDRAGYPGNKNTGGHSLMNNYTAYYSNVVNTGQKGTGSGGTNMMSNKAVNLFEKGDTRFEGTFMTISYNAPLVGTTAKWGTDGYLAVYNCTEEELLGKYVAMRFFSAKTTKSEAEAEIKKLVANGQAVKPAKDTYGVNTPFAAILSYPDVTVWEFTESGKMPSSKTVKYEEFITTSANNGTCVKKYDDPTSGAVTGSQCYRDIPLLHVSEMYLVAAEAYYMAGDSKWLDMINAVRKRAGVSELKSFANYKAPYVVDSSFTVNELDLILDERAREMYAERTRFHDLRRTKQLVRYNLEFSRFIKDVSRMSNAAGEIKWYRPIPQDEINANAALTNEDQNPGY